MDGVGVLSANPKTAEQRASRSGQAVLWLGETEPPLALVTHLRSRGVAVAPRTDPDPPVARLVLVQATDSPAARNASIKNRRVAVIHPDPGSADALAQALRARGAQVVALSLDPGSLDRVEALDPDAVLMEATDFYGSCWEIVRALWQHPRLKYAPVLLATPEGQATYAQGTPDVPSLCLAVKSVSEAYERIERSAQNDDSFAVELAELGPAKLLRVLSESGRGFRVSLQGALADFELDVAEGIIVGAQSSAKGAANDGCLGVHALALLMTQERGTAQVRVADHPAATNVMAPLDAALHAAREAKATSPQDATTTRAVAARRSMPSPSLSSLKQTLHGAPALKPPANLETARPSKWPEAKQAVSKSIEARGSARELELEPEVADASRMETLPAPPLTEPVRAQEQAPISPPATPEQAAGAGVVEDEDRPAPFEHGEESIPALAMRHERWHVWAALGGLGAALGWLGMLFFGHAAPPSVAAPSAPLAVAQPAAQDTKTTLAARATDLARAEEPAPIPNQAAGTEATDDRAGESVLGSPTGALAAKPPARQASALVSRGHDLRKRKQYAQAKARYQQALALLPGYPRALAGLAQLSIAQNRGQDAVQLAQKLVAARPRQATYQLLLGDAYKAANRPKEAQQAWQTAARSGNAAAKARLKSAGAPPLS